MPKLPVLSGKKLIKILSKIGFKHIRTRGSHAILNKQDKTKGKICHAELGAELAKEILKKYNLPEDKIKNIVHCIKAHRFRKEEPPQTKEAQILYDADKIDSIGAIGIGRAFLFAGQHNHKLSNSKNLEQVKDYEDEDTAYREFVIKLSKVKDKLLTDEGKRIAEQRHNFMENFFNRFLKEIDGEL